MCLGLATVGFVGLWVWRDAGTALLFLAAGGATSVLVPFVARVARTWGAIALPGGRDVHDVPTPLIGGAALYVPIACTLAVLGLRGDTQAWGLLAGGTLVFLCGLLDDTRGVQARVKILVQLLAAAALIVCGFGLAGVGIPSVGVLWITQPILEVACICVWIVIATNAFNLADGADGVATTLALVGLGVLAAAGVPGSLPIALAGACLGFLYYNLPKARIFLGDAGSMLLGFLLAAMALKLPVEKNLPLAFAAFAYPLGDVMLAVARRFVRGKPLFAPDRSHLHHKALEYLGSPLRALLAVLAVAGLQAALCVLWPSPATLVVCCLMWVFLGAVLVRLSLTPTHRVFADRKYMRRIHLLHDYVSVSLDQASSRAEVLLALRHLTEGLAIESLVVADLEVLAEPARPDVPPEPWAEPPAREGGVEHVVHSALGFCSWRAASTMPSAAVEQERENIMTKLVRKAEGRLAVLPADRDAVAPVG